MIEAMMIKPIKTNKNSGHWKAEISYFLQRDKGFNCLQNSLKFIVLLYNKLTLKQNTDILLEKTGSFRLENLIK